MPVQELPTKVTLKGNPVTLIGKQIKIGQTAPDCTLTANDLSQVKLSSFKGTHLIIASVPSLDTPICDLEMKRFNQEAQKLNNVQILCISMDLPFAQKRWCAAADSQKIQALSDYRDAQFGENFGVLIKGLRLLARAIFVIGGDGKIRYAQIVDEIAKEPDYQAALDAARKL